MLLPISKTKSFQSSFTTKINESDERTRQHTYIGWVVPRSETIIDYLCNNEFCVAMMKQTEDIRKNYNPDERLDHIAYMLNVRTTGKAYENFIVNAIYTKVGNPDLMPYTQQYVHSPHDSRQYYLLDLYFPQLDYGVEIDEGHHLNEVQKERDKLREEDIRSAIECEEDRIPIFDANHQKRSYEEVCKDIDRVVQTIREKISEKGPLKWESNAEKKRIVEGKGRFSAKDDVYFDTVTEIYNICGGKRTGNEKGTNAKMMRKCYYRLNDKYKLWVPVLAIADQNNNVIGGKNGFKNTLSEDHSILKETSDRPMDPLMDSNYKRVIFMRMKDRFGRQCIKFIGLFEISSESTDYLHVYNRIAEEVCISDLK